MQPNMVACFHPASDGLAEINRRGPINPILFLQDACELSSCSVALSHVLGNRP
jgi:hypothetical protein